MKNFNKLITIENGQEVLECPVLGEGGRSEGYIFMTEGEIIYIPKTSPDLKETLSLISDILKTIATGIFQENLGGAITTETFAVDLAELRTKVEDLKKVLR